MITNPPRFRITPATPRGEWVLTAACGCSLCNGRGTLRELSTGEEQTCDCPWEGASEEIITLIEEGAAWSVDPSPSFVAFMEMLAKDTPEY